MVPQTFQKATELNSSQFDCCLQTSHGKKYRAALIQNTVSGRFVYKICTCCGRTVYRGDTRLITQYQGSLKDIFSEKWHPKLKNQNPRGGVQCVQSTEKRKLQCTAAKTVMQAFVYKIALSCTTRNSITKVMKIIILHLDSFKIILLKFQKNRIFILRIIFF